MAPCGYCGILHPLGPSLSCPLHFSVLSAASWFFTHTLSNFGDPNAVSGDSDTPLGCGDAVRLFFSMPRSAGTGLWCSRSRLGLLLRSAGITVAGCVQRGRFWGVF